MTTFVYTWNAAFLAAPADTDPEAQGASQIRSTRGAVGERFVVDHSLNGDANDGTHLGVTMQSYNQTTMGAVPGGFGRLFASPAINGQGTTNLELFWQNAGGQVFQLTQDGGFNFTIGTILLFGNGVAPGQWQLCDGHQLQISQWPGLYAAIGGRYPGSSGGVFAMPNIPSPDGGLSNYWIYGGVWT